jgi:hypothetical protein
MFDSVAFERRGGRLAATAFGLLLAALDVLDASALPAYCAR